MFLWMAGLTAVVVVIGAASIAGPLAAVIVAAVVVALGVFEVRRRRGGGEEEDVFLGPQGERIRFRRQFRAGPDPHGDSGPWPDVDDL